MSKERITSKNLPTVMRFLLIGGSVVGAIFGGEWLANKVVGIVIEGNEPPTFMPLHTQIPGPTADFDATLDAHVNMQATMESLLTELSPTGTLTP